MVSGASTLASGSSDWSVSCATKTELPGSESAIAEGDSLGQWVGHARSLKLLTAEEEVFLARRVARGDKKGERSAHRIQSSAGRIDRPSLQRPRSSARRSHSRGQYRADPRRREVRSGSRIPLLHLRDLVDSSRHRSRRHQSGPYDPNPGLCRRHHS